jgi:glucokinase
MTYYCGVDLGGTKLLAAIASDGVTLAESEIATHGHDGGAAGAVTRAVADLCAQLDIRPSDLSATVVAGAGAAQPDGTLHLAPNLIHSSELDLSTRLRQVVGTVVIENDVNAAAIAESMALHSDNFVFIAIGTGIGMGIIHHSAIVRGAHGAAGEIGYLPFGSDPLDPENHRHGPLEEVVSGRGIENHFRLKTTSQRSAQEIFRRAAADGSGPEDKLIDQTAYQAARAVVSVCAILDPELIVLGGGIGSRTDFRDRVARWVVALGHDQIDLRPSIFGERATLEGAIELARRAVAAPEHEGTLHR